MDNPAKIKDKSISSFLPLQSPMIQQTDRPFALQKQVRAREWQLKVQKTENGYLFTRVDKNHLIA
jgi:hypothetical protein